MQTNTQSQILIMIVVDVSTERTAQCCAIHTNQLWFWLARSSYNIIPI